MLPNQLVAASHSLDLRHGRFLQLGEQLLDDLYRNNVNNGGGRGGGGRFIFLN